MANLVELFDNIVQMQALNGVPLANGKLYVYALGRTRLMDTWSDVDGESLNTNPIILDDAGQAHCFVSDDFDYTLVVCDEYNNEVFSIDKYLYSKGEHSHADVAVAPSEHIGVSSYHVGETTVYVPYIQGELGKTYHGIEPIVVNNQENKISARNIPLGVQEPLYFVEDSESACIIGASGLQPSGNYATVDWVLEHDYMQKEKLEFNESGQVTGFDGSAFAAGYVDPSDFIPWSASGEFQSAGNYATTDDLTAYYPNSNPNGFINSDAISAMATTGFVADVSADITAMIPTALTGDYLTKDSADTLYQPLGDYATTADLTGKQDILTFNYTDTDEISGINGSAIHSEGGSVTGEYELSAGNGISINNDPINQKTVISVSGDYLTKDSADTLYQPTGDYLSSNALEGYATENWVTSQGYITTETDWSDTITAASANAYNEATAAIPTGLATTGDLANVSADITAQIPTDLFTKASADTLYQPLGNYLTTGDSANFATTGDVEDLITSISETYQTTAGMTAYQSAGDYLTTGDSAEFMTTAERSDYIPTGVSSEFYTTANTANYISEVPDTYLQNTDLSTTDGKVTAISGIPLSAGGDVPEGVMVESGLEYNAQGYISGYAGSAITGEATIYTDSATMTGQGTVSEPFGVKSTDLFVQEPLYTGTSGNSAYIGWNNETVLYQAPTLSGVTACTLSESIKNFQYLAIQPTRFFSSPTASKAGGTGPICYYNTDTLWQNTGVASDEHSFTYPSPIIYEWQWWKMGQYSANDDWTELVHISGMWVNVFTQEVRQSGTHVGLYKVVGINRKV